MRTQPQPQPQPQPGTRLGPQARLAVRFTGRWQSYYPGDVATFPARMAANLVARGKAQRVNIAPPDAPVPPDAVWATRPPAEHVVKGGGGWDDDIDL
jgi:hypothetical protein